MLGLRTGLRENRGDVAQGLAHLRDKAVGETLFGIPADDAASDDNAPVGGHAIGIALRHRPTGRLEHLRPGAGFVLGCCRQHREVRAFRRRHGQFSILLSFRRDAGGRHRGLRQLPQGKSLQFAGLGLR